MARQIITGSVNVSERTAGLKFATSGGPVVTLPKAGVESRLRLERSKSYVKAMTKLDAGTHLGSDQVVDALINAIQAELPELTIEHQPLGIIARCALGDGHDVHTLDRTGNILVHFKTWQSLPALLERGRSLALHAEYAFVEVYIDKLCAVRDNGEVSLVRV